ncbi:MAG: biopolymer transporter ExbD [Gemmataceae bacterium]|nr:biopolymer transporter ExbD [Gemmataceae bacterium]MCS7270132.1 biopolymer transporter ExbD [Gemmataceae bacterium]MDW8241811.1 biopolymer transporter ExbD [Thermogemmata sp.]
MAETPKHFDVWFVRVNTVYKKVPYEVVAGWIQQGRLAAHDRVAPSGANQWITVQEHPLLADYLSPLIGQAPIAVAEPPISGAASSTEPDTGRAGDTVTPDDASTSTSGGASLSPASAEELFEHASAPLYHRSDDDEEVDMVPLIDISMVLLVFFIMIRAAGALAPVDVPEMRYAGNLTADPDAITIVIDKLNDEQVYYAVRQGTSAPQSHHNLLPTPEAAVRALDEVLTRASRPPEVRIACHKDLPYERILELQPELEDRRKKNIINSYVATVVEAPRE